MVIHMVIYMVIWVVIHILIHMAIHILIHIKLDSASWMLYLCTQKQTGEDNDTVLLTPLYFSTYQMGNI